MSDLLDKDIRASRRPLDHIDAQDVLIDELRSERRSLVDECAEPIERAETAVAQLRALLGAK